LATEKEPVSAAWEAMIVAAVARNTIGSRAQFGASMKNGLNVGALTMWGWARISAP
jgi:hypothetical protein